MRLFLLMLIVTAIEVVLIAKVGSAIGFLPTFIIIVLTALIGSQLLKQQWRFVMSKMQSLQSNPSQALLEALVLVICGVLLITPGFLTDIIGFIGLIPQLREAFVALLRRHGASLIRSGNVHFHQTHHTENPFEPHGSDDIIEGEFERRDNNDDRLK